MSVVSGSATYSPLTTGSGGGGNLTATYITKTPDATLTNSLALSTLATGILMNTTTTGNLTIATLSGLSLSAGTLSNDLTTGKLGGQSIIGGTASANNLIIRTNTSGDGQVFFGAMTNPSYWVEAPTSSGRDNWMFKGGKPSLGKTQVATFASRGNAVGDDITVGFGAVGYAASDGGASISTTRIECVYVATNNLDLRFFTTVSNVGTEFLRLDGLNSTLNFFQSVTVSEGKNFAFGTTTGTMHGTAANQKQAFWGKTPVVQQARPTDAASIIVTGTTIGIWA